MPKPKSSSLTKQQVYDIINDIIDLDSIEHDKILTGIGITRGQLEGVLKDTEIDGVFSIRLNSLLSYVSREAKANGKKSHEKQELRESRLLKLAGEKHPLYDHIYDCVMDNLVVFSRMVINSLKFGNSVTQLIYKEKDGIFIPNELLESPVDWFFPLDRMHIFTRKDGVESLSNLSWSSGISLIGVNTGVNNDSLLDVDRKFLLLRNEATHTKPRGVAMLAKLWWFQFFKQNGWGYWADFLESSAVQRVIGEGKDPEMIAESLGMLVNNSVAGVPQGTNIKEIPASSNGEAFDSFEKRIVTRIWMYVLGRAPLSEMSTGSRAGQQSEDLLRLDLLQSDVFKFFEVLNKFTAMICRANGLPDDELTWYFDNEAGIRRELADRDAVLASSLGVQFSADYVAREYNIELSDIEIQEKQSGTSAGNLSSKKESMMFSNTEEKAAEKQHDQLDSIIENAAESDDVNDMVLQVLKNSENKDDFIKQLALCASYGAMGVDNELLNIVDTASLLGLANVQNESKDNA